LEKQASLGRAKTSIALSLDFGISSSSPKSFYRENGTGVLFSVDEIGSEAREELRELTTTIQHAFREDREVAFVAAGLPGAVSDLLQDKVLTFLRRADRHPLGSVDMTDVRRALRERSANHGVGHGWLSVSDPTGRIVRLA
jgi:hypothetical protein